MMHSRLSLPHVEARACRDLWCAVLLSVLRDLCNAGARSTERGAAERWVGTWPDRDFRIICHLAGVDPDWLHGALSDLVSMPVANRRQRLATRLDCQPGQIGICLMVRQAAFDESGVGNAGQGAPTKISGAARRVRVAEMLMQGMAPSEMPRAFEATGRIGYAHARNRDTDPNRSDNSITHIEEET